MDFACELTVADRLSDQGAPFRHLAEGVRGEVVGVLAHFQYHVASVHLAPLCYLRRFDYHDWIRILVQCNAAFVASLRVVREDIHSCFCGGIGP